MSALPAAVRKQVAKANKLAEQFSQTAVGEDVDGEDKPVVGQEEAEAPSTEKPITSTESEAKAPVEGDDGDVPTDDADGELSPPAPANKKAAAPVEGAPQPKPTDWEQKYKVLQGKYNAEIPRMQRQLQEASSKTTSLERQLQQAQQLLGQMDTGSDATTGRPAQKSNGRLVDPKEVEEFGEDLYSFIQRAAQEAVLPHVEQKLQPVSAEMQRVQQVATSVARETAKTAQDRVHELLSQQVPDWLTLNEDEDFLHWLGQVDPFSGALRGDLLRQAYERCDGPRVVAFFQGFLNEHAATSGSPPAATDEGGTPQKQAPQVNMEKLVAPGSPKAGGQVDAQDGAGKRIWTRAQIAQFYRDRSAGVYRKRDKEAKKLEADIYAAQREGRIR